MCIGSGRGLSPRKPHLSCYGPVLCIGGLWKEVNLAGEGENTLNLSSCIYPWPC